LYLVNTPWDERQEENRQLGFLQVWLKALKELLVEGFSLSEADESSEHEFLAKLKLLEGGPQGDGRLCSRPKLQEISIKV
jgi:hypothetical protein